MTKATHAAPVGAPGADHHDLGTRVGVLGPLTVEHDGRELHVAGSHRRRLLALLASRTGRTVGVDAIVDALWGEDPPPSALKTIQSHVARLRQSLHEVDAELIETTGGGYRLRLDAEAVDAHQFEHRVAGGRQQLADGDRRAAEATLADALALWRGAAYAEFDSSSFAVAEAVRLEDLRLTTVEDLAEIRIVTGGATATSELERLVASDPGRERAWALLMRALYAAGRQHDALVAFRRARRELAGSYGLDPGPELRRLERQILEQDPALDADIARPANVPTPLRTSGPLHGRQRELTWLLDAWALARRGAGQVRIVLGGAESGGTRLAGELAARAVADGGSVDYVRSADGLASVLELQPGDGRGRAVDAIAQRSRRAPLVLVVDDVEWADASTIDALIAVACAIEHVPTLLVLIADPSSMGPAVSALARLDGSAQRMTLGPLADDEIERIVRAERVEAEAVPAVVAVAGGSPGVARRESAAWVERTASDRLHAATSSAMEATTIADHARDFVVGEVLRLVAASSRKHDLTSQTWLGRQPYRELASYEPGDVDLFVGRERLIAELAAKVLDRRLVIVVGASGSGKSSIVRAGLIPLVRSGRLPGQRPWRTTVTVPGRDPLAALDEITELDEPGPQLVVLDQFEEAFAAGANVVDALAARLDDLVLDPALDAHVVLVVRADQFGALAESRRLSDRTDWGQLLVGPPSHDEIRRIIEEPARRTGCTVEVSLVDLVAQDVEGRDTMLPLLSVAMADVWRHRDRDVLRTSRYVEVGGLGAAVERLGEHAVDVVGPAGVDALRRTLLALADVTDDGAWVRRRLPFDELPAELEPALDALTDARLVAHGERTSEIVHEVVFRAWPRLAQWLEEARADLVVDRELRLAARTWDEGARSDDDVLRGARLAAAEAWVARNDTGIDPWVGEFVAAGRVVVDREHDQLADQLVRETRSRRRFGRALVAAAVLLAVALVAGLLAVVGQRRADDERAGADAAAVLAGKREQEAATARDEASMAQATAETAQAQAETARLVAESEREIDSHLDRALLLAAEAFQRADTPETKGALLTALTSRVSAERSLAQFEGDAPTARRTPTSFQAFLAGPPRPIFDISLSDDGQTLATLSGNTRARDHIVIVYDVSARTEIGRWNDDRSLNSVQVSPDGDAVLVVRSDGIERFDVRTGTRTELDVDITGPADALRLVTFSPDGQLVSVTSQRGVLGVYEFMPFGRLDVDLPGARFGNAGFAPDGTLAIALADSAVGFWEARRGTELRRVPLELLEGTTPGNFAFAPDMSVLIGVEQIGRIVAWDLSTGRLIGDPTTRPGGARGQPEFVAPYIFAVALVSGGILLYDVQADRVVGTPLLGHGGGVRDVTATPDGRIMASAADDGLIGIWGTNEHGLIDEQLANDRWNVEQSADGETQVLIAPGGPVEVGAPDRSGSVVQISSPSGVGDAHDRAALSADGRHVVVAVDRTPATVFVADTQTGQPISRLRVDGPPAMGISSDGSTVAVLDGDGLSLFDVDTARRVATATSEQLDVPELNGDPHFSADGRYVDITAGNVVVRLRLPDLTLERTAQVAAVLQGNLIELPSGELITAAASTGQIYRVDLDTGAVTGEGQSRESSSLVGLALSADGTLIAAHHAFSSRVTLFDAATLRPIGRPFPVGGRWFRPEFTADGDLLGNGLFGVSRWEMDPDAWLERACVAAGRNLTTDEWSEYLGEEPYRGTCEQWPAAE